MPKFLPIFIFLFAYLTGTAQFNNDFLIYSANNRSINLNSEYEINSSAFTNDFVNRFLYGGKIDLAMKEKVTSKLMGDNRLGGHLNLNAVCFLGKKSSPYTFTLGVKQQQIFNTNFGSDLFKLGFYGNKMFEGKTANLGNTNINYFSFQEYKLGIIATNIDTLKAAMGLSISYLRGLDFLQLKTNNTTLFTSSDATLLSLNTNLSLSQVNQSSGKTNATSGNGASVEFFAELPYRSKLGKSKFFLSVNNLGFIRWNNNVVTYTTDSVYNYSGIHIKNIFDLKDSTLQKIQGDSILNQSTHTSKKSISSNLPTSLFIVHKINFTSKYALLTGFRHLFNANYKPYIFIENDYIFNKYLLVSLHFGYGGFGTMNSGMSAQFSFKEKYCLKIGSNSLQGFISPKNTSGQGAYFCLSYKI